MSGVTDPGSNEERNASPGAHYRPFPPEDPRQSSFLQLWELLKTLS